MYFCLVVLSLFFAVTTFFRGYIKNIRGIKYIYPENWYKVVKIYIFALKNLNDVGCNGVTLLAKRTDKSNKFIYDIPIKICIPQCNSLFKEIKEANINFVNAQGNNNAQGTNIHISENKNNIGNIIPINQDSFVSGYEGRYFINITSINKGIEIPIKIEAKFIKKDGKEPKTIKSQIIVNGQEDSLIKFKI